MVFLDNYRSTIEDFILASVQNFNAQHGEANSVGIYCCPWAGWLTINLNLFKSLEDTNNNCPDFEFAEFDILDFTEWQEEYEAYAPTYKTGDTVIQFNHEMGDERLNEIFFAYLLPIVTNVKTKIRQKLFLQFLDSNCSKALHDE